MTEDFRRCFALRREVVCDDVHVVYVYWVFIHLKMLAIQSNQHQTSTSPS